MRPFILSICLLIGAATAAVAADGAKPDPAFVAAKASTQATIRLAQNPNRGPSGRRDRESVVEGCGVRDALCVANRLLRQMERRAQGPRRRQIDDLGKQMQRICGQNPKDVVCAGDFVSQALNVMTDRNAAPGPLVRDRGRGGPGPVGQRRNAPPSVAGLRCIQVRGYRGLFPARADDNRHFGGQGLRSGNGPESCAYAISNWNRRFEIVCTNIGSAIAPQNLRDGFVYGAGSRSLGQCVEVINGIRNGAICARIPGSRGFRVMDIASRRTGGPSFPSVNQCLGALDRRR